MFFKKKKTKMIDIRQLQRRGVVRIPDKEIMMPTDSSGFIELGKNSILTPPKKEHSSNEKFFGYGSKVEKSNSPETNSFSTSIEGYNKREVDTKIIELDNKIYKLEQRLELIEKKVGVNQSSNSSNLIGW